MHDGVITLVSISCLLLEIWCHVGKKNIVFREIVAVLLLFVSFSRH